MVNITFNTRTGSSWRSANSAGLARGFWAKVRRGGAERRDVRPRAVCVVILFDCKTWWFLLECWLY